MKHSSLRIALASVMLIALASSLPARADNLAALGTPKCQPAEEPWALDEVSTYADGHNETRQILMCWPSGVRADDAFVVNTVQSLNHYLAGAAATFKDGAKARVVEKPKLWRDPSRDPSTDGLASRLATLFARI